ncbi:hypothetical protein MPTA7396_1630 [Mycoplasmoides pneumoniae]|uniref:Uncharacterized protein n=2 Tax=Mycoplasmoides pneumoniae TaxID=2104 RepID=A0AAV5N9W4_MYCPM|nr:hypothetical protein [Mycoplasmoides pneumoniae]ALA31431.1 hypothetical protein F536_00855 [Mycoplasmoides pneumoniae 39443]ALA35665.1 MgpC-like protein MPN_149 [Mycoplasmoides pneumoniae FH]ALA36371.1 MgpC-like protein MPN_149 [Mycoplasmoides pneumoniae M1139]ALA37080.1 MgpC-like protein MPN_149 [Mycoplasmoides pneumoniae]ALA37782.1 MgpC-like protein MPN_149 [Mycoplasmoides pneumoniae M2592]
MAVGIFILSLNPSYELVDWKRVGDTKLVALVRSALVRVKFNDGTSSDSNNQDTNQNALSFDTQESQKALNGSQSGSSDTSGSNSQDFASYILIFQAAPRATWVFERKIKLELPYVKNESGAGDSTTTNSGSLYTTLQDLLVEQPVTPYTPNAGLARVNGAAQDTVHFGSGQESSWNSQRSQKVLKNNPGPKVVTGFKLDKGRAYRKLNEAWPVYEPLDSTKDGKGKDESSWNSSEKTTAESDAPLVGSTGSQMAAVTDSQQSGDNNGLVSLAQRSTTVAVQKSDSSGSQGQGTTDNKFQKYLNTTQALHQMGVIVPSLETWAGENKYWNRYPCCWWCFSPSSDPAIVFHKWRSTECNHPVIPYFNRPTRLLKWPDRCDGFERGTEFVVLGRGWANHVRKGYLMSPHRVELGHRQAEGVCGESAWFQWNQRHRLA